MINLTRPDRRYKSLLAAGLLLILLWLGLKGWRVARAVRSLQTRQQEAETLLEGKILDAQPEMIEALVLGLRRDIVTIENEVGFLAPLGPAFGWLPRVGPLLAEAPPLLAMADAGTAGAVYAFRGLKPALELLQAEEEGELIPRLLPILEEAGPDLAAADAALHRMATARAAIEDMEALPWRVRTLLAQMDDKLYLADMVPLLQVAPQLLGADAPRTYLLLAQNEDEIRPTGGFLTGVGRLTVSEGQIGNLEFSDSNIVDAWGEGRTLTKPYNPPPAPLSELMGLSLFLFRDANYWPDFPTSAEQAVALYRYGQNAPPVDGVIALDQQFIVLLLAASGPPLPVPELGTTVSAGNVIQQMRRAWEEPESGVWLTGRKDFFGPIAEALKTRFLSEFTTIDPIFLADTLHQALEQKHLQIYVRDPEIASILDAQDWDGRLEAEEYADLLLPIDTNVGYNKVGSNIETALTYEVALDEEGRGEATTTLVYTHSGQTKQSCRQGAAVEAFARSPKYAALVNDCFWNFLRLYVPRGSVLLDSSAHPTPPGAFSYSEGWTGGARELDDEPGDHTVFGNFFLLPQGESIRSVYRYQLPQVVLAEEDDQVYRLTLPRQAGADPRSVTVQVTLPDGARLLSATPAPAGQSDQTLTFDQVVVHDFTLTIVYDKS